LLDVSVQHVRSASIGCEQQRFHLYVMPSFFFFGKVC
jgi:hypothetical protein